MTRRFSEMDKQIDAGALGSCRCGHHPGSHVDGRGICMMGTCKCISFFPSNTGGEAMPKTAKKTTNEVSENRKQAFDLLASMHNLGHYLWHSRMDVDNVTLKPGAGDALHTVILLVVVAWRDYPEKRKELVKLLCDDAV